MDALVAQLSALVPDSVGGTLRNPTSLFALLAVTALVLYGLSVGRTRALVSLLAIYVAYVLALLFPFAASVTRMTPERYHAYTEAALFIAAYIIVFGLISHSIRRTRLSLGEIAFWQVLLISVVQIGLLGAIILSLVPEDGPVRVAASLRTFFAGPYALWGWAAASLLIMPFMRGHRRVD